MDVFHQYRLITSVHDQNKDAIILNYEVNGLLSSKVIKKTSLCVTLCINLVIIYVKTGSSYFQPLSWNLRMRVALGAARGLAYLHSPEAKVIYRDFKPSNILIDSVRITVRWLNLRSLNP